MSTTAAPPATVKDEMRKMLDRLPDDLSWEDLAYHIEVRIGIEKGLQDIAAGRTVPHAEVLRQFGMTP